MHSAKNNYACEHPSLSALPPFCTELLQNHDLYLTLVVDALVSAHIPQELEQVGLEHLRAAVVRRQDIQEPPAFLAAVPVPAAGTDKLINEEIKKHQDQLKLGCARPP